MFKYSTKSEYILAITTSSRRIVAVLLHDSPTGPLVLRTFNRKRDGFEAFAVDSPPIDSDLPGDVSFTATDEGTNASMFLASEFGDLPTDDTVETELMPPTQVAVPCDLELQDIVSECADAGYENVRIVFALPSEYVDSETITVEAAAKAKSDGDSAKANSRKSRGRKKGQSREMLIKQLRESHPVLEDHQVAFIPLFDFDGNQEARLALFSQSNEPVSPSLESIRNRKRPFPNISLLDNEVSLLLGGARAALLAEQRYDLVSQVVNEEQRAVPEEAGEATREEESTVLIRVGSRDTLVMFMVGSNLVHFESLRSITAFDPTETICSRILLMYDEFGAGDSDRILLFCDESEIPIKERLEEVFPDSNVSLLRHVLPPFEEVSKTPVQTDDLLAVLAGLRLVRDELWESVFPATDFLNPKLRGRKITLPFSWPVAAMILVLFSTTLFFVHRYFAQSHEIEMVRFELRNHPEDAISGNANDLQSQIDSLRLRSTGFVDALDILDSLLIGSDVWSRALERTSVHTSDVDGLWISTWGESNDNELEMVGTALDRSRIVEFATRAEANIERITYSEIRGVPVFEFKLTMLMDRNLPEAARYLREHAAEIIRVHNDDAAEASQGQPGQEAEISRSEPTPSSSHVSSSERTEAGG